MMASKLQTKLLKENKNCIELAIMMADTIYPRLISYMRELAMEEVRFKQIVGLRDFCITIDWKLQFFTLKTKESSKTIEIKESIFELDLKNKNICVYFNREEHSIANTYESATEFYIEFCEIIIDTLKDLETKSFNIKRVLEKAKNIQIPLERKVIIEKHKYGKTK